MAGSRHFSYQLLAVAGTLSLTLVLFFSPRAVSDPHYSSMSPEQARINLALSYISDTKQPPMRGILMMRDIADADSLNSAAVYYTAEFSMRSGQYDKAVNRYQMLLKTTKGPQKIQAAQGLVQAYLMMGDTTLARTIMAEYFDNSSDSLLLQSH